MSEEREVRRARDAQQRAMQAQLDEIFDHEQASQRFRSYDPEGDGDVPDPYYGGPGGFDEVFAMVERTCRALLAGLE